MQTATTTRETLEAHGSMDMGEMSGQTGDLVPMTTAATSLPPTSFSVVVAMTASRAIGQQGQLPWGRLPKEMAAFRDLTRTTADPTKTNAMIMGRVTFDSLPRRRPLPGRLHVVLTRRPPGTDVYPDGVLTASGLDEAIALVGHAEKVFVIGGAQVYKDAIAHPACAGVWLTQIASPDYPDADAFFPALSDEAYGPAEALDESQCECGVTYQRLYRARLPAAAADP
ncbi:Dihydrofolate reductase [Pandoravirus quercus]|uniref:dihydrofolate reductase n=1 Tax=Pandoravirus quercus TaxID=2107709 RepID=A0A2U7U8R5_9VIRU|nr:Dihydrofolate reductase [Pandoravirus quercus]AVK74819.1 Dihydrofolate reductase [Pandoravirus quercus]